MNDVALRMEAAMKRRNIRIEDLAAQSSYSVGTLRNIKCGNSKSRRGRQFITNALKTPGIFPGVDVTESWIWLTPNVEIESRTLQEAKETEQQFGSIASRHGRVVHVIKPILLRRCSPDEEQRLVMHPSNSRPKARRKNSGLDRAESSPQEVTHHR